MPDTRIQIAIAMIAREQHVSLSEARRILVEKIDLAKREKLLGNREIIPAATGDRRGPNVKTDNPHRKHIGTDIQSSSEISEKQRDALQAHNAEVARLAAQRRIERTEQIERTAPAQRESVKTISRTGKPNGRRRTTKSPLPGSMTGIIYGELSNPENDFNAAFVSLKAMARFDHLRDDQLKQRMREVAWRYNLPLDKRGYA